MPNEAALQLSEVPFAKMIETVGKGIAEAQYELDKMGMRLAQMMSGKYEEERIGNDGEITYEEKVSLVRFDGKDHSLLELGFVPNFYQFVDTLIEIKMSVKVSLKRSQSRSTFDLKSKAEAFGFFVPFAAGGSATLSVSTVSTSVASKYQYSAEGASTVRTKLVPVPPPAVLEERIRTIAEREAKERESSS